MLRNPFPVLLALALTGCAGGGAFVKHSAWPFGNPNKPKQKTEMTERVLGRHTPIAVLQPQAGDVWPGPVTPFPTLNAVAAEADEPLGAGYQPSLPSPYPPGKTSPASAAPQTTTP